MYPCTLLFVGPHSSIDVYVEVHTRRCGSAARLETLSLLFWLLAVAMSISNATSAVGLKARHILRPVVPYLLQRMAQKAPMRMTACRHASAQCCFAGLLPCVGCNCNRNLFTSKYKLVSHAVRG